MRELPGRLKEGRLEITKIGVESSKHTWFDIRNRSSFMTLYFTFRFASASYVLFIAMSRSLRVCTSAHIVTICSSYHVHGTGCPPGLRHTVQYEYRT